jgi:hypothetical protein
VAWRLPRSPLFTLGSELLSSVQCRLDSSKDFALDRRRIPGPAATGCQPPPKRAASSLTFTISLLDRRTELIGTELIPQSPPGGYRAQTAATSGLFPPAVMQMCKQDQDARDAIANGRAWSWSASLAVAIRSGCMWNWRGCLQISPARSSRLRPSCLFTEGLPPVVRGRSQIHQQPIGNRLGATGGIDGFAPKVVVLVRHGSGQAFACASSATNLK